MVGAIIPHRNWKKLKEKPGQSKGINEAEFLMVKCPKGQLSCSSGLVNPSFSTVCRLGYDLLIWGCTALGLILYVSGGDHFREKKNLF